MANYNKLLVESLLKELILGDEFPSFSSEAYINFFKRYCYNPIIAPLLQKTIIEEVAKLKPKDFNKSRLEKLIKDAVAAHGSAPSNTASSTRKHEEDGIDHPAQRQQEEAQPLLKKRQDGSEVNPEEKSELNIAKQESSKEDEPKGLSL